MLAETVTAGEHVGAGDKAKSAKTEIWLEADIWNRRLPTNRGAASRSSLRNPGSAQTFVDVVTLLKENRIVALRAFAEAADRKCRVTREASLRLGASLFYAAKVPLGDGEKEVSYRKIWVGSN